MNTSAPSVGIGILNWNGKKFLESLLPQLYNLTYVNYTIYVIDNTSTDDSVSFVREFHPSVNIIALDDNHGFAGGYNRGFAKMHEDYYLMMNSDVDVPTGIIEPLLAMMESDSTVGICQPKLLSMSEPEMLEHAGAAGGLIDFLGYPFCRGRIFDYCEKDRGQFETPTQIFWASGACCLVRKEAYWKINGMYDFYFMHSEEIDMCWRLIAEGYKIMYCPRSYVYHLGGGTLSYKSPTKTYLNFRNNIIMCFRNSPWYINIWLLPFRFMLDIAASLRFLIKEDKGNCKAVFLAYRDFLKWVATEKGKYPAKKKSLLSIPFVLTKSIAWQYYISGVKNYDEVKN
jgi:GT2 family glycosyltransferase